MKTKFDNSGAVVCEMPGDEFDALVAKARALDTATFERDWLLAEASDEVRARFFRARAGERKATS